VKRIEPEIMRNGRMLWMVTYESLETKAETTKIFDAVVLCNGHYSVGRVPHISGIESFCGKRIHSHQYRMPEVYAGKKVCILGASWSGTDIAMEVSQYANKVRWRILCCQLSSSINIRSRFPASTINLSPSWQYSDNQH